MNKLVVAALPLLLAHSAHSAALTFTNSASVDAFIRAAAPTSNYGGAGALAVSGSAATNAQDVATGAADSFIRFNTAGLIASFNTAFGSNLWEISSVRLRVTEQGAPANSLFNRGQGAFAIYWIGNDKWVEGTGNPNAPTTTGIAYQDKPSLLNPALDLSLGVFTNAADDVTLSFPLTLSQPFLSDIKNGGEVGLYLTALDSITGFTFSSRTLPNTSGRPYLEVTAVNKPFFTQVSRSGQNFFLAVTNGSPGTTAVLLTASGVTVPLAQWTPVATNSYNTQGTLEFTTKLENTSTNQLFLLRSP